MTLLMILVGILLWLITAYFIAIGICRFMKDKA